MRDIDRCIFLCNNNVTAFLSISLRCATEEKIPVNREEKALKGTKRIFCTVAAVLIAFVLSCSAAVPASAVGDPLKELIEALLGDRDDNSINSSTVSAEKIMLGESLYLYGDSEKADPEKCQYAFYVRPAGFFWITLQDFSSESVYEWSPKIMGDFEFCIKVKYKRTTGKKYFKVRVSSELYNESYISTSFVQQGGAVELTARSHGGFGEISYAFLYKKRNSIDWSTLSGFSTADHIKWKPVSAGDYDICIKIRDEDDQLKEKYYEMTVAEPLVKTPTEFTLTVRSPVSSPYFWECETEDRNILEYYVTEKPAEIDELRTYVVLEYHFITVSAGNTSIKLSYDFHNGKQYQLMYDVTVDKNLNYTVSEGTGDYSEPDMPEPEQVKTAFSLTVAQAENGARWRYEVSDPLVADVTGTVDNDGEYDTYNFEAVRQGYVTVTLTCVSLKERRDVYKLIYDIYIDDRRNVTVIYSDGFYREYESLPEIETI